MDRFLGFLFQADTCHLDKEREKCFYLRVYYRKVFLKQMISHEACDSTFIWRVWRTCYLPPQLCEVLIHQIYFNLVFTCLKVKEGHSQTLTDWLQS